MRGIWLVAAFAAGCSGAAATVMQSPAETRDAGGVDPATEAGSGADAGASSEPDAAAIPPGPDAGTADASVDAISPSDASGDSSASADAEPHDASDAASSDAADANRPYSECTVETPTGLCHTLYCCPVPVGSSGSCTASSIAGLSFSSVNYEVCCQ